MNALTEEPDIDETIDFGALLASIVAGRWWIIGCVILFTGGFWAAAFMTVPVYRATTLLAPATSERGADVVGFASSALGGLASGLGIGGPRDAETEEALAVLQSREFTESFVVGKKIMPKLFAGKWDAASGAWKVDEEHQPTPGKAYKYFDKRVRSVLQDRKTGLVTIQIDWTDRNEAADWANELVRQLNTEMRTRAIAKAEASMRFLENELQSTTTVEARAAISRLIESQVKQRMLANVTQDYSFRVVDRAIAADKDDPVKPQKALLVVLGPLVGFGVGVVLVLVFGSRTRKRPHSDAGLSL